MLFENFESQTTLFAPAFKAVRQAHFFAGVELLVEAADSLEGVAQAKQKTAGCGVGECRNALPESDDALAEGCCRVFKVDYGSAADELATVQAS